MATFAATAARVSPLCLSPTPSLLAPLRSALTGQKYIAAHAKQFEPADPYYEILTDEHGNQKRRKRDIPAGLSKRDARALRKIRKRAHYLDKGINLCGFRVGWTFFIGTSQLSGPGHEADPRHHPDGRRHHRRDAQLRARR